MYNIDQVQLTFTHMSQNVFILVYSEVLKFITNGKFKFKKISSVCTTTSVLVEQLLNVSGD